MRELISVKLRWPFCSFNKRSSYCCHVFVNFMKITVDSSFIGQNKNESCLTSVAGAWLVNCQDIVELNLLSLNFIKFLNYFTIFSQWSSSTIIKSWLFKMQFWQRFVFSEQKFFINFIHFKLIISNIITIAELLICNKSRFFLATNTKIW